MEQVVTLLEGIASKLGVAVEHLWEVLVRQQHVQGIADLIWAGIGIIIIAGLCIFVPMFTKYAHRKYVREKEHRCGSPSDEEEFFGTCQYAVPVIGVILSIFIVVCTMLNLELGIQKLLNPEYFALKELLDTINGG